jgi:ATP-dependent DNA helicase RecQ
MAADPQQLLQDKFGFTEFRQGQQETINILLSGRSAAAIFPTGSGKSLCYQLTALLLPGLTLVVSPLLALMKDQIDALQARNIAAERLDSSLTEEKYREVSDALRNGSLKMLFVSPERLTNERFLNLIRGQRISLLAVDEAHCISAWGHNFRPDYLKLTQAVKSLGVERVLALTATATPKVAEDMAKAFAIAPDDIINTGYYRPNLEFRVTACRGEERDQLLLDRLSQRPAGACIIYVHLQKDAERLANLLCQHGYNAAPYHAGLKTELRSATQDRFMAGQIPIICATIAFGMGIDKADIRYIYHYHLAKGFESYLQETGRAGRDGEPAICELFACADDCTTLENFVYGDTPDRRSIASLLDELLAEESAIDITARELASAHDIRPLVVSTLLTHLELLGVIRFDGYYYSDVRFEPHQTGAQILGHYNDRQAAFLQQVLSCCSKARKWVTLDVGEAVAKTGQQRDVILRALDSLQEKGLITQQLAGYRQRFTRLESTETREDLCQRLTELFHQHEQQEIQRIDAIIAYAQEQRCLTQHLLGYFGETIEPCGHCGVCLGDISGFINERNVPPIPGERLQRIAELAASHDNALGTPRQQTRFLCGLNSPAVTANRNLRGHPLFSSCAHIPFKAVLEALQQD